MLLLILELPEAAVSELTLRSLPDPGPIEMRVVRPPFAERMNELLRDYRLPYFAAVEAGALLHPPYWLCGHPEWSSLPAGTAGLVQAEGAAYEGPFLWNTELVRGSGGFEPHARLPFDSLVLESKYCSLGSSRPWKKTGGLPFFPGPGPRSGRGREIRELIGPLVGGAECRPSPEAEGRPGGEEASDARQGETPLCSVVLCHYRNADLVPWAVRSVLAQTSGDWELILVDDGSPVPPGRYMADLLTSPRIRTVLHERNEGKAAALNTGLACARGTWLIELDADDWLHPSCVASVAGEEGKAPAGTALLYGDHYEWLQRPGREPLLRGRTRYGADLDVEAHVRSGRPVAPRIYRTEILRRLGGWPLDGLFGGRLYEDMEMLLSLAEAHPLHYVPKPLYHRRIRQDSVTRQKEPAYLRWLEAREEEAGGPGGRSARGQSRPKGSST
ncbi:MULTISPECIES: glycosyltransferase family 2 protein [Paenibacillus]|uniref:glycosyltransferase family 2 protein n=1 Tax=Paenibacillus TaxID=44249 RepID=UPI0022B8696A|nr:glycosyltransferase [Paenibacillus caseinilyticus]MCZ8518559.1 glycosyltransferase [Paenibacillus caseinilyticus]